MITKVVAIDYVSRILKKLSTPANLTGKKCKKWIRRLETVQEKLQVLALLAFGNSEISTLLA